MTGRKIKRLFALALSLMLIFGFLPFMSIEVEAAGEAIVLGGGAINPGQVIYMGNNGTPEAMQWRVLGAANDGDSNSRLLLSEYVLESLEYDSNPSHYHCSWDISDIKPRCAALYNYFQPVEQNAIKATSKVDEFYNLTQEAGGISHATFLASSLNNERIFILSVEEAINYFSGNEDRIAYNKSNLSEAKYWWLRSMNSATAEGGDVYPTGALFCTNVYDNVPTFRPAFNLDLSRVVYTRNFTGNISGTVGGGALSENPQSNTNEAHLVLLDDTRSFKAGTAPDEKNLTVYEGYSNWGVNIKYSEAKTGANEYVSAMLCSGDSVLYYGNIANNSESGSQKVSIPRGLAPGSYNLRLFNESMNGTQFPDESSAMVTIPITVKAIPKVSVSISGKGKAEANPTSAIPGSRIKLTFTAEPGNRLREWKVATGDVEIGIDNTFIMPDKNVNIIAVFEEIPKADNKDSNNNTNSNQQNIVVPAPAPVPAANPVAGTVTRAAGARPVGTNTAKAGSGGKISFLKTSNKWAKNSGDLELETNGKGVKLSEVYVDKAPITDKDYTVKENGEGKTILSINASYLETLSPGVHTIKANADKTILETTVTIEAEETAEPVEEVSEEKGSDTAVEASEDTSMNVDEEKPKGFSPAAVAAVVVLGAAGVGGGALFFKFKK